MQYLFLSLCLLLTALLEATSITATSPFEATKDLPIAFQGRFRSLDPAARLWLYDFYHAQQLKQDQLPAFHIDQPSALELLWKIHFMGHISIDDAPLFWIHYAAIKELLDLDLKQMRFSYLELKNALSKYEPSKTASLNNELQQLIQAIKNYADSDSTVKHDNTALISFVKQMKSQGMNRNEIADTLEAKHPLSTRLQQAGTTLKMLPSRSHEGEWLSLHALQVKVYDVQSGELVPIGNFTSFSDAQFQGIQLAYEELDAIAHRFFDKQEKMGREEFEEAVSNFANKIIGAYNALAGTQYKQAIGKGLYYPSIWQLKAETLYYRLPLIELSIVGYGSALILFLIAYTLQNKKLTICGLSVMVLAFLLHTTILALRCYILQRPPVSNMFETVVYVPWIVTLIGLAMNGLQRNILILMASSAASLGLLIVLKLTDVDARLENVQAVLDSQYWLIVHVLMVVGSYGVFVVCGVLGHFFLIRCAWGQKEDEQTRFIAKCILHTMYVGVALLIPGTILGGVWAAESWGRFWDWDPKESWAFISACVFVIIIHAYTFKKIGDLGLAIGSVAGLMAISFTWYGVNYILGTGLHSYGFGKGGEIYYFGYLLAETLFLGVTIGIYLFFKAPKKFT